MKIKSAKQNIILDVGVEFNIIYGIELMCSIAVMLFVLFDFSRSLII